MSRQVLKVANVSGTILKSNPPQLAIVAVGIVSTTGWTNARLEPYFYVMPPADGIQDFDFVADPPTGMTLQVLTPITAGLTWPDFPAWVKGVRIHAQHNKMEWKLDGTAAFTAEQIAGM
jgi:hypothetical protein